MDPAVAVLPEFSLDEAVANSVIIRTEFKLPEEVFAHLGPGPGLHGEHQAVDVYFVGAVLRNNRPAVGAEQYQSVLLGVAHELLADPGGSLGGVVSRFPNHEVGSGLGLVRGLLSCLPARQGHEAGKSDENKRCDVAHQVPPMRLMVLFVTVTTVHTAMIMTKCQGGME